MVPSPKIVINLLRTYEKLPFDKEYGFVCWSSTYGFDLIKMFIEYGFIVGLAPTDLN